MSRFLFACVAALAAALAGLALGTSASARGDLPPGSWVSSCQNAYIDGDYLYAQCLDRRGRWRNAFVDLSNCDGPISNEDGRLVCAPEEQSGGGGFWGGQANLPGGNWVDVCAAASVSSGIMQAECSDGRGRFVSSNLDLSSCGNVVTVNRGRLVCEWKGTRWGQTMGLLPRGDWVKVCSFARVNRGTMQAQCDDGRGRVVSSSLNLRSCRANDVTVNRGQLRCR